MKGKTSKFEPREMIDKRKGIMNARIESKPIITKSLKLHWNLKITILPFLHNLQANYMTHRPLGSHKSRFTMIWWKSLQVLQDLAGM